MSYTVLAFIAMKTPDHSIPTLRARGRPRTHERPARTNRIQAIDRALDLIEQLPATGSATLKILCAATGLPSSTAYRILETLRARNVVEFDERDQSWSIGVEAFRIGQSFAQRRSFMSIGRDVLRELTELTGETSNIAVCADGELVHVSQVETDAPIRAFLPPGTRSHLYASAIGKALLAHMTPSTVRLYTVERGFTRYTPRTRANLADLQRDLEQIRSRGWAYDDEERHLGLRCIAAPIFNDYGEAIAGVSISGPITRLVDDRIPALALLVVTAAETITYQSGGRAPK
ncbi:MAG: IclR family transcriptional regulator [Nevskiaceae bacterium]|nr:MAG: IclR family transcriptional regulator [Nevskiaceae bacterium]TBR73920.1 MAG: IclR family transcriptional regulator [Nevskiaceae bacterium]